MLKPQTQIWIDRSPTLARMTPERARICLRYAGAERARSVWGPDTALMDGPHSATALIDRYAGRRVVRFDATSGPQGCPVRSSM